MHRNRTALALVCAATLALTLTACGGDSALSAKEFRAQANDLCAEADKDTEALGAGLSDSSSEKEVTDAIDKLVERTEKLVDDIDELEAPDELADGVDAMLDSVTTGLEKIDDATVAELGSMEDPFADANEKAKKVGLDKCAA